MSTDMARIIPQGLVQTNLRLVRGAGWCTMPAMRTGHALLSLLIGLAAAAGLGWLVYSTPPTTPNLATALALLVIAVAGLAAPLLGWLHRRIPFGGRPPTARAALRQALLLGLAAGAIALLQLRSLLDGTLLLGVLALVVLVEVFMQSRRAQA
jgi:hypothetical protein